MQSPNPETPPERAERPDSFLGTLERTARRTAGPILLLWMAAAGAEFLVVRWLAQDLMALRLGPWWDVPANLESWAAAPVAALVLPLIAAFRTALFRPARAAYRGEDLGLASAFQSARKRILPVFSTRVAIEFLLIFTVAGCLAFRVRAPIFVLLPLGFTVAPALYVSATRDVDTSGALWEALRLVRHHWLPIFAAHGIGLIAILLFSSGGGAGVAELSSAAPIFPLDTLATLHVLGSFLVGRYLDWLIVTSMYVHLDS